MLITPTEAQAMWGYASSNPLLSQLVALLPAADQAVKTYCQLNFESATYTEYHNGNNQQRITLKQIPVVSITSLFLNDSGYFGTNTNSPFDSTTQLVEGQNFVLDHDQPDGSSKSGIVFRIGSVWPMIARVATTNLLTPYQGPCLGNIKVVYAAGYTTIPADLQYAVAALAQFMRRSINFGGMVLESEKLGDYAYKLLMSPLYATQVGSIVEILGRYKETGW